MENTNAATETRMTTEEQFNIDEAVRAYHRAERSRKATRLHTDVYWALIVLAFVVGLFIGMDAR
jgi:hypothetical protein